MAKQINRSETEKNHTWYRKGVMSGWIDRYEEEMIRFMEQKYGLISNSEKLCAVFASLFVKAGHVSLPLEYSPRQWGALLSLDSSDIRYLRDEPLTLDPDMIQKSKIIGKNGEMKPLLLHSQKISFRRHWNYESDIVQWINRKSSNKSNPLITSLHKAHIASLFPVGTEEVNWQKTAAALSLVKDFLIISGGPGTGKTTTVAKILTLHQRLSGRPIRIALAAPTGKAAGRMGEALYRELDSMGLSDEEMKSFPKEAKTIHRLLYGTSGRGLLPSPRKNVLRYDLIIVDEASMIDLQLMHQLTTHTGDKTRLILLGDKDQLASVEAGSVFSDLCRKKENGFNDQTVRLLKQAGIDNLQAGGREQSPLDDSIVYLTKSYRFKPGSGIGILAGLIQSGNVSPGQIVETINRCDDLDHFLFDYQKEDFLNLVSSMKQRVLQASAIQDPAKMLDFWKRMTWLVALRRGFAGSERLNMLVEQHLMQSRTVDSQNGWYHSRPVMISRNDYNIGVFNGDLGVCMKDEAGNLRVYVESGSEVRRFYPERVTHCDPAYFLTVHKSQGSEFDQVNLLLPVDDTPILTRELLYTAVTRSRKQFSVYGNLSLFEEAMNRKTERFTGLRDKLNQKHQPE